MSGSSAISQKLPMQKGAFASFAPIARAGTTFVSTLDNQWSNVRLFGNFPKAANAKKRICLFCSNCSSRNDFFNLFAAYLITKYK
jgi:hypothetical protein